MEMKNRLRSIHQFLPVVFMLFCLVQQELHAQVILYVSPGGSNSNPGTAQKPFKSIEQAVNKSKGLVGKDVVILLQAATYYLDTTLIFQATDNLFRSLVIKGQQDKKVTISAGTRLSLQWKSYKNGIFVAKVKPGSSFERLYVNGKLQVLARYPNYDSTAKVFNGTSADALSPERLKKWRNPVGGYVHAIHASDWGGFHYRITGLDANGQLQLEGGWQNNRPSKMHPKYRFVENVFEELDAPGEWWLDRQNGLLYYFPAKNIELSTALIEVSHLYNSIELRGSERKPVRNISIQGIQFAHNERSFMLTNEPLLRSDWTIYRGGAIVFEGTEDCAVSDCVFEGLGGNAVMVSNYNRRDTITGCHIYNIGASAICFIGSPEAVRSPAFRYEAFVPYDQMDTKPGPLTDNYPADCSARDNLLHDLGRIEKQATGVEIETASSIQVSHNSIYNTPRAGINIGDGCFGGHIIEFNDVFNTVQETGDHGSFNSWGRDRFWHPNRGYMDSLVAAHPELILLDARKQTILRNNRFRCDNGWDIDLDDGSTNYLIYKNVCLNGGLKFREGFYRVAENNILVNNTFHPHVWFKNSGDVFRHNIVMKPYAPIGIDYWGKQVDSNFFSSAAALEKARASGTDMASKSGQLIVANSSTGNYTLVPGSPAFAVGFVNFPMDEFGVLKPSLKKIALTPAIPAWLIDDGGKRRGDVLSFAGAKLRSVSGLGDRSAYGLPDETGVIVLSVESNGELARWGIRERDVILAINDKPVKDVNELKKLYYLKYRKQVSVTVMRNQQPIVVGKQ